MYVSVFKNIKYARKRNLKIIFDLGLKIHKNLGPGLLESAYEECLFYEISKAGSIL